MENISHDDTAPEAHEPLSIGEILRGITNVDEAFGAQHTISEKVRKEGATLRDLDSEISVLQSERLRPGISPEEKDDIDLQLLAARTLMYNLRPPTRP